MKITQIFAICFLASLGSLVHANDSDLLKMDKSSIRTVDDLVVYSVQNSSDSLISEAEVKIQSTMSSIADKLKKLPQIDVYGTYQDATYYENRIPRNGTLITNSGTNRIFGASVSYDLQKLFGPENVVARGHAEHSEVLDHVSKLNIRRVARKSLALFLQIRNELKEIEENLSFMNKVQEIIARSKKMGVFNEIETGQYKIQKDFLLADRETKNHELDAVYAGIGLLMNLPVDEVKPVLNNLRIDDSRIDISRSNETVVQRSLGADYHLAKLELDSYQTVPLPTLFVRSFYQDPTIPSFQGKNHFTEYGLTFNLTNLFIRSSHKAELQEKVAKTMALKRKNELDYENNVKLAEDQKKHFQNEAKFLNALKAETTSMLKKSFLYYSQRRIDILTLMDISQKNLQASQRLLLNQYHQSLIDADLEYYFGRN